MPYRSHAAATAAIATRRPRRSRRGTRSPSRRRSAPRQRGSARVASRRRASRSATRGSGWRRRCSGRLTGTSRAPLRGRPVRRRPGPRRLFVGERRANVRTPVHVAVVRGVDLPHRRRELGVRLAGGVAVGDGLRLALGGPRRRLACRREGASEVDDLLLQRHALVDDVALRLVALPPRLVALPPAVSSAARRPAISSASSARSLRSPMIFSTSRSGSSPSAHRARAGARRGAHHAPPVVAAGAVRASARSIASAQASAVSLTGRRRRRRSRCRDTPPRTAPPQPPQPPPPRRAGRARRGARSPPRARRAAPALERRDDLLRVVERDRRHRTSRGRGRRCCGCPRARPRPAPATRAVAVVAARGRRGVVHRAHPAHMSRAAAARASSAVTGAVNATSGRCDSAEGVQSARQSSDHEPRAAVGLGQPNPVIGPFHPSLRSA